MKRFSQEAELHQRFRCCIRCPSLNGYFSFDRLADGWVLRGSGVSLYHHYRSKKFMGSLRADYGQSRRSGNGGFHFAEDKDIPGDSAVTVSSRWIISLTTKD